MPHSKHHSHHINLRLERWHRRCMIACWAALLASGVLWLLAHYFLRPVGEFGETVSPLEPWAMKLHGAGVMLSLFFIGSLMNSHIRRAIKARRNVLTGWSMIGTLLLLIVTGFGLYYIASEGDRPIWSLLHWVIGLGFSVLAILHILIGRRQRQRQAP